MLKYAMCSRGRWREKSIYSKCETSATCLPIIDPPIKKNSRAWNHIVERRC